MLAEYVTCNTAPTITSGSGSNVQNQTGVVGSNRAFYMHGEHGAHGSIPTKVRITPENAETDNWGYWKLKYHIAGCGSTTILEEPASSPGPPPTFGAQGVANWPLTPSSQQELLSRNLPEDPYLNWSNWWIGRNGSMSNTYDLCKFPFPVFYEQHVPVFEPYVCIDC